MGAERVKDEEIQQYKLKIEHLNKIILKSPFSGEVTKNEILSGTRAPGQNFRRPSYFNMGARLGPTGYQNERRRQSAFTFGSNIMTPENSFTASTKKTNRRLIRSGSLGLCDETGNEEIDDLLCLPAKAEVYFEKEKTRQMEEKLTEKDIEVQEMYDTIAKLKDIIEDYEKKGVQAETAAPVVSKKKTQPALLWSNIKTFKIITGIRSRRTGKHGSKSGPVVALFIKNVETHNWEYHGRTEWIQGFPDPVFSRPFTVKNDPELHLRFSVYDVDNQQQIDQGDFIGVYEFQLKSLIEKFDSNRDQFIERPLETDNNEEAWLKFKLKLDKKKKSKKKNKILQLENKNLELENKNVQLKNENLSLKRRIGKNKKNSLLSPLFFFF